MDFSKVISIKEGIDKSMVEVFNKSNEYLIEVLNSKGGRIDFDDYGLDSCEYPCVTYDGGNHPEYAAYPYATVYAIFNDKNGGISLELGEEYEEEYGLDRVYDSNEIFYIAEFIYKLENA